MPVNQKLLSIAATVTLLLSACSSQSGDENGSGSGAAPLADIPALDIEETGKSENLQDLYKDSWVFAHDLNFNTIGRGKIMVIDAGADVRNYRGQN